VRQKSSTSQKYVRDIFEEKFQVRQDEDYTLHDLPTPQEVNDYALGRGPGPSPEDLRIDMKGKINSIWNIQIVEILLAELKKKDKDGLPQRSEAYLADLIEGKLERVRTRWRNAQPRLKETGGVETITEVESRMVRKKDDQDRANRAYSRRRSVRLQEHLMSRCSCLTEVSTTHDNSRTDR
jgi:hypothetical protein